MGVLVGLPGGTPDVLKGLMEGFLVPSRSWAPDGFRPNGTGGFGGAVPGLRVPSRFLAPKGFRATGNPGGLALTWPAPPISCAPEGARASGDGFGLPKLGFLDNWGSLPGFPGKPGFS